MTYTNCLPNNTDVFSSSSGYWLLSILSSSAIALVHFGELPSWLDTIFKQLTMLITWKSKAEMILAFICYKYCSLKGFKKESIMTSAINNGSLVHWYFGGNAQVIILYFKQVVSYVKPDFSKQTHHSGAEQIVESIPTSDLNLTIWILQGWSWLGCQCCQLPCKRPLVWVTAPPAIMAWWVKPHLLWLVVSVP